MGPRESQSLAHRRVRVLMMMFVMVVVRRIKLLAKPATTTTKTTTTTTLMIAEWWRRNDAPFSLFPSFSTAFSHLLRFYYMQIDSHTRFLPSWDRKLVAMQRAAPLSHTAILTQYVFARWVVSASVAVSESVSGLIIGMTIMAVTMMSHDDVSTVAVSLFG